MTTDRTIKVAIEPDFSVFADRLRDLADLLDARLPQTPPPAPPAAPVDDDGDQVTLPLDRLQTIAVALRVGHSEARANEADYGQSLAYDFARDYVWLSEQIGRKPVEDVAGWLEEWDRQTASPLTEETR